MNVPASVPVQRSVSAPASRPITNVFSALQQEVDRLFHDFGSAGWGPFAATGAVIKMDMADTQDGIELTAELPGLEEKDVKVTLSDNRLTISGEKQAEKEESDKNFHFVERTYGSFSRSVDLPPDIEVEKIEARIANGVLKVTAPRTARAEPKTIEVKSAA